MRRLFAVNLIVVVLAPWIAALSGAATPVVPCPMHRSGEAAAHGHATHMPAEHDASSDHHGQHHGTSARGCNCAGECGRSGASLSLQASGLFAAATHLAPEQAIATERRDSDTGVRLLPPATGPPQRLQS